MRGRKPSNVIQGNHPVAGDRKPPGWLTPEARCEWRRVLPILVEHKTLTEADIATFANYCQAIGTVIAAQKVLTTEGLTYTGNSGPKRHPATGVLNDAMTQARQLAAELGLTPVSRSRPTIRDDDDDDSLLD